MLIPFTINGILIRFQPQMERWADSPVTKKEHQEIKKRIDRDLRSSSPAAWPKCQPCGSKLILLHIPTISRHTVAESACIWTATTGSLAKSYSR
ncbi:MAG: hypothetical protein UW63_C0089G0006 [Candidatus Uhrbacteria bacterium GW2011_GWF2_44_350]|uniref:Uncharacterized protein n=1 Tax=Candidatus Uhrbacteria bacterium GW2011_GWF2_44_350 TaxID=1619000 RepID=A0A0G1J9R3_9BACT|nr:MAG: hypothetical protein UW63_C0089G0006 [Candidatus Uhrbacteria bacterium GW2011_GWF2_44_350]